jgi:Ca2+-binding EF-hand superfamily protein
VELDETFTLLAEGHASFSADRLLIGLKALGIEANEAAKARSKTSSDINLDEFIVIVSPYLSDAGTLDKYIHTLDKYSYYEFLGWIQAEMLEAMSLFDQDNNGDLDASEVAQVFVKLGEKITKNSIQDQIDAWSRSDKVVGVEEFFQMVLDKDCIPALDETQQS